MKYTVHRSNSVSLHSAKRAEHLRSAKYAAVVGIFFLVAWAMLQWALGSGPAYASDGIPRDFVEMESAVCAAAITIAALKAAVHGIAWLRLGSRPARRQQLQRA